MASVQGLTPVALGQNSAVTFAAEEGLLLASEDSPQPPLPVPPRPSPPCETVQGLSAFHSIPQKRRKGSLSA